MNKLDYFTEKCRDKEPWHALRYALSWEWVEPFLTPGARVLDAGGESPFTAAIRELCPGVTVETTTPQDLRYLDMGDRQYDLVLMMEVIEHIKDREDAPLDTFAGNGITHALKELARCGKRLFLSTPNLCCARSVQLILSGYHPFMFQPHVRELAPRDVVAYCTSAGWFISGSHVQRVWNDHRVSPSEMSAIAALARQLSGDDSLLRGDCLFLLAHRP